MPESRRPAIALAALSLAAFCFVTAEVLPTGLLIEIADDMNRSQLAVGLLVTAYAGIVLAASAPLVWLTRRVSRRHLLACTLAMFAATTILSAIAPDYPVLLAARLLTAVAQALFWSVVASAAVGLVPQAKQGKAIARLAMGSTLAPVAGVPAGVWLGQSTSWRTPFVVLAALGILSATIVLYAMPPKPAAGTAAARGSAPDRRSYLAILVITGLAVTGAMSTFTYIAPYLLEVAKFAPAALGPLLLVAGLAGIGGAWGVGQLLDRHPRPALVLPLAAVSVALTGLAILGSAKAFTIIALAVLGLGFNALGPAIQSHTLRVAPGSADMASAGSSAVFNAGIAAGSLLGGALLSGPGVGAVPAIGAVTVAVALGVAISPWGPGRGWKAAAVRRRGRDEPCPPGVVSGQPAATQATAP